MEADGIVAVVGQGSCIGVALVVSIVVGTVCLGDVAFGDVPASVARTPEGAATPAWVLARRERHSPGMLGFVTAIDISKQRLESRGLSRLE